MVEKKSRQLESLDITDKWQEHPELGTDHPNSKWIAEITLKIATEGKIWGDQIWFFICSSSLTEDEILSNEEFDVRPGKYILQNVLDEKKAEEFVQQKIEEVSEFEDKEAAEALEKYFFFD